VLMGINIFRRLPCDNGVKAEILQAAARSSHKIKLVA